MIENFKYPVLHVIDADKHRALWHENFSATAWYGDHQIISKGEMRYQIVRQQTDVFHYYVWVRPVV